MTTVRVDERDGLRRYDVETPTDLVDMLARTVADRATQTAFIDSERSVNWSEFAAIVTATARGLAANGVSSGDRVALLAGNGIPLSAAYWAIWQLGAIAVPLNHRLTAADLADQLDDSRSRMVLVGRGKEELGASAAEIAAVVITYQNESAYFFAGLDGSHFVAPVLDESSPAAILYTSGTTGRPKGVVISHGNALQNSITCTEVAGRQPSDVELVMVPQFNVTGLCSQTVPVVHLGMTAVLLDGFEANRVVEAILGHGVTSTVGAPTMWWRILEALGARALPSLRLALYGGAPMPVALLGQMRGALPAASFGNGYGMTETCSMITYLGGNDAIDHPESVGRPLPVTELRILRPNEKEEVDPGQVGEVAVRGPQLGLGYWTSDGIQPLTDSDGWLRTGDAARLVDGFVVLADRLKDVIKRGGESIFSIEVEEVLYQHPQILEAAVIGTPDDVYGERVLAVVVPKPGSSLTADEIRDHCRRSLAAFKVPTYVVLRDELPRNPGGKVLKAVLKNEFRRPAKVSKASLG